MSATNVSTRTPPSRVFANYVLTHTVDSSVGLARIKDADMTPLSGPVDGTGFNIGQPVCDDGSSYVYPIGFDFQFNNTTYKSFVANVNGWMALVDPATGTFTFNEVMFGSVSENAKIKIGSGDPASNAVLLAPWFDDLINAVSEADQLNDLNEVSFDDSKLQRIKMGLEPAPRGINALSPGVKYINDVHSSMGRRLIVRWNVHSNMVDPRSIIKFEVALYENGTIEFRYAPKSALNTGEGTESASVGIFTPTNSSRFRDFSTSLGYVAPKEYVYGGATYDASFTDVATATSNDYPATAHYAINLTPFNNWPGGTTTGGIFTFSPPVNRRKVLPRNLIRKNDSRIGFPLTARTGDGRTGVGASTFDDRRSLTFGPNATPVNYPSTLPRFAGGSSPGVRERQDLFTHDFLVTSSINKNAIEQFMNDGPIERMEAFNESFRHEQDQATLGSTFFTEGTDVAYVSSGFDQSLKSKTQVRFSLPVDLNVTMPDITSSIYYYNSDSHSWEVPSNSSYIVGDDGTPPDVASCDWADAVADGIENRIAEDARGFGPIGNQVSSGSTNRYGNGPNIQTNVQIGAQYSPATLNNAIDHLYVKSVRNNEEYRPTPDETFTIPITAPFLVEKAIFEIPLAAGPGWFNDLTQCFIPGNSAIHGGVDPTLTSFDFAGPALTVALYRQVQLAENTPGPSRRDLIMTGTITHTYDNVKTVQLSNFPPLDSTYQVRPVGFLAYANPPGAVVQPNVSNYFTGSVTVSSQALSSVGTVVKYLRKITPASGGTAAIKSLLTNPNPVTLSPGTYQSVDVAYVSPFGRGGTGFQQSGRCVLGNEYITKQGLLDPTGQVAPNPFYETSLTAQQAAALAQVGDFAIQSANASAAIPLISHFPAPYLVMPGDKLVLSVSKMRPVLYQPHDSSDAATYNTAFSSSVQNPSAGHDVQLMAGTINVTLYGSQIREGVEFHDTLNQPLGSDAVHEIIGADPVLDQFEPAYRHELSGSFTDNVMLGSLSTDFIKDLSVLNASVGNTSPVNNTRVRYNSVLNAPVAPPLSYPTIVSSSLTFTSTLDQIINPMKSYRLQPWIERAGDVRLSQFINSSERFYDSMMPSIDQCFSADGCGIFTTVAGTFGDTRKIDTPPWPPVSGIEPLGWIFSDVTQNAMELMLKLANGDTTPVGGYPNFTPVISINWNKAFPFEPRYAHATRQFNLLNGLNARYQYDKTSAGAVVINTMPLTKCRGLMVGTTALENYVTTPEYLHDSAYQLDPCHDWISDVNLLKTKTTVVDIGHLVYTTFFLTGSARRDDLARTLFGFGDRNTYFYTPAQTSINNTYPQGTALQGTGHFPCTREHEGPTLADPGSSPPYNDYFHFSPVIRGWKYGVLSGIPTFSKCLWRRGKFGQFRDMLEQRLFTKFYESPEGSPDDPNFHQCIQEAVVNVKFISPDGRLTNPLNTWTSNLNFECTSSLPFFDGIPLNRPSINLGALNKHIITFKQDNFGNVHL